MSSFMQTCVERHIAEQDSRTLAAAPPAPAAPCVLCKQTVDLSRQLDFVLCSNPHPCTLPSNLDQPLRLEDDPCRSVFHLSCLADSFLQQQSSRDRDVGDSTSIVSTVLPTHGTCPCHTSSAIDVRRVALWADVVRGMYRRHERFERLLQLLVRSGRTLAELLVPPAPADAASPKKSKPKAHAKATHTKAATERDSAEPEKKVRKRRQPTASKSEEILISSGDLPLDTFGPVAEKTTKRKTSRKAKVATDPADVIDLT